MSEEKFKKIISHAKEYGFIFQSSEIYDGLSAVYDYGQNGVLLKNNIKDYWWKSMINMNDNIVGLDSAIFSHPTTWKASGHLDAFNDPLIDNKDSKKRYRADVLIEEHIEKLNLKTELLELNTTGILKDILTNDYEVSLDLSDIDISEEEVSKALNLNQEFTLPILFGNINLNDGFINYNFSQINTNNSSANIYGTGLLEDKNSFDFNIILDLLNDDELLSHFNLDNLKMVSRFKVVPDQQITFNGDIEIVDNDNTTNVDFNTSIVNNNLSSKVGITKQNVRLDYEIYGNLIDKKLNADGKIFLETIPVDNINHIIAETNIEIDFSVKNNIQSNLKLKEISIDILNDKIYQLTWKNKIGFIYDLDFNKIGSFNYNKSIEGWGLTNDGEYIYKSDGTSKIWRLNPSTLEEIDFVDVMTDKSRIRNINELEYIDGKIYANTYQQNRDVIIIINPMDGAVESVIDFTGIRNRVLNTPETDVMNGIAKLNGRLFVTGKNWDKLFEVKIYNRK